MIGLMETSKNGGEAFLLTLIKHFEVIDYEKF